MFVSMRYFVNAFETGHSRAEQLVVDLTASNTELESTLRELKQTQKDKGTIYTLILPIQATDRSES